MIYMVYFTTWFIIPLPKCRARYATDFKNSKIDTLFFFQFSSHYYTVARSVLCRVHSLHFCNETSVPTSCFNNNIFKHCWHGIVVEIQGLGKVSILVILYRILWMHSTIFGVITICACVLVLMLSVCFDVYYKS